MGLTFRYGPSPSGDVESLGYIIMDNIAGLPWLEAKLLKAEQTTAQVKILAAIGAINIRCFKNDDIQWHEVGSYHPVCACNILYRL